MTTKTHTREFPKSLQDKVEATLRATIDPKKLESVRPERRGPAKAALVSTSAPQAPLAPAKTVPVTLPQAQPMTSADAISLDLPSKFHYYSFKDLYVKPFRATHLAKLAKGRDTGSLQIQVEAVSSVLSTTTGETDLAFKLTTADYNAVLYWLRLTSFAKHTMRVTHICRNPEHHKLVKAGSKPKDSLLIETVFEKSDIKYDYLDQAPNPEVYNVLLPDDDRPPVSVALSPETMADTIAFLDSPNWADEEYQYSARIAGTLGNISVATGKPWSWDQRIQLVQQLLTADQAVLCEDFARQMDSYGVRETINVTCKECGYKGTDTVTCDPQTFLTPRF